MSIEVIARKPPLRHRLRCRLLGHRWHDLLFEGYRRRCARCSLLARTG